MRLAASRSGDDKKAPQSIGEQEFAGRIDFNRSAGGVALERAKQDKEAHGELESECPGYCGAQDTFYVGTLKGVGPIYQQTFIDTYSKVAFAKLYDRKTPIVAADLLNDRVLPFFEAHEVRLSRVLTDRGTQYCGTDRHEYEFVGR